MSIRTTVHEVLDTSGTTLSWANRIIVTVILASIGFIVFESEATVRGLHPEFFDSANLGFATFFTIEYFLRLWAVGEDHRYKGFTGRLRYMVTPMAIVDLLALVPFYLVFISDSFILRLFRIFRIVSLVKLNRYTKAVSEITEAIWGRRFEVMASFVVAFVLMLVGASVMVVLEGEASPEDFGSIPRAMWWAIITLTSVGYGDDVPISLAGRLFTGVYALIGVGFAGMIGGIMAASMFETFKKRSCVDVNDEYPTDKDYSSYELGFNTGYIRGLENSNYANPYQKTEHMISAYWGFEEGAAAGRRKYQKHQLEEEKWLKKPQP